MIELEILPFGTIGKFLFENKKARIITILIFSLTAISSISILIYDKFEIHDVKTDEYIQNSILPVFLIPTASIAILFLGYLSSKTPDLFKIQLEKIREERVEITQKIEEDKELDIFHTIQLSLNQLNEYYTINKRQATSSFRFSIFSIVVGLMVIVTGISFSYLGSSNISLSFISGISGVLLEFIGGAYFFMYKKSLEQVNFFFGQLIKIQDTMLAINLVDNITSNAEKDKLNDKIITSLLERSLK